VQGLRARLSAAYGFRVPESFARFVDACFALGHERIYDLFDFELSVTEDALERSPQNFRAFPFAYEAWRPELFPFASPGVDGMQYVLLVHAPELELEEYPIAEWAPMDFDSVLTVLGDDLRSGLETIAGYDSAFERVEKPELGSDALARRLHEAIGLSLERKAFARGEWQCYVPNVPSGWHFEASRDGVGVLAPRDAFRGDEVHGFDSRSTMREARDNVSATIDAGIERLNAGYPASAMLAFRRAAGVGYESAEEANRLFEAWARSYEQLGRPLLAEGARQMRAARIESNQADRASQTINVTFGIEMPPKQPG
jgi:hypothetical protein